MKRKYFILPSKILDYHSTKIDFVENQL